MRRTLSATARYRQPSGCYGKQANWWSLPFIGRRVSSLMQQRHPDAITVGQLRRQLAALRAQLAALRARMTA